jgi:NAD(P)-dependent dehydrogenase (short-subunit alcohol dehydrogenase family)
LLGLTRAVALEVARDGITVNAICPGPVHTLMNDRRVAYDAQRRGVAFEEQASSMTLIGRRLEPEEIAPLAVYLASDEAAAVTGQAFNVCGGIAMS